MGGYFIIIADDDALTISTTTITIIITIIITTASDDDTVTMMVICTNKLKKKQISYEDRNPKHYEEEHLVALGIGGNPRDPKNLWPEPHESEWNARIRLGSTTLCSLTQT